MTLAELLGTDDSTAQIARVQQLLERAQVPAAAMLIQIEQHRNLVHVVCTGDVPLEAQYQILDLARRELLRQERAALNQPKHVTEGAQAAFRQRMEADPAASV